LAWAKCTADATASITDTLGCDILTTPARPKPEIGAAP
jgi:hypothetical protein